EISQEMEGDESDDPEVTSNTSVSSIIAQIIMLDIIFSFDSILTAIGLTKHIEIMVVAVVLSILIMIAFAGKISDFIHKHPTMEVLALDFLYSSDLCCFCKACIMTSRKVIFISLLRSRFWLR